MKRNDKIYWDSIEIDKKVVYIKIHIEHRRGVRMSFGKEYILLRIPVYSSQNQVKESIEKCKVWVTSNIEHNPDLIRRYHTRDYKDGSELTVMDKSYIVSCATHNAASGKAVLKDQNIILTLPYNIDGYERSKMIRTLLSRIVAKICRADIQEKVDHYNDLYIKRKVNKVVLKYNTTNWGSCSTNNNINISTRTLLAPMWVINYVIVHELCHLMEMNHSKRFWKHVENIYPDYIKAEAWLKEYGSSCYF